MHISWRHVAAKTFASAGFCTVVFFGSGCATIVNGRSQAVTVSSEPPGANVFVGSRLLGVTPVRLELKRREEHIVLRFEKDGFVGQEIPVKRSVSGWIAGNVVGMNPLQCQGLSSVDGCRQRRHAARDRFPDRRGIRTPRSRARGAHQVYGMNTPDGAADAGRPLPTAGRSNPAGEITVTPADCSVVCCARSKLTSAF